jgi:hypothetical protein
MILPGRPKGNFRRAKPEGAPEIAAGAGWGPARPPGGPARWGAARRLLGTLCPLCHPR